MFNKLVIKLFAALAIVSSMSAAHATLVDVHFTVHGDAAGTGVLTVDSALLAPGSFTCCDMASLQSLSIAMNLSNGNTFFTKSDLSDYFLAIDNSGVIEELGFRAYNADDMLLLPWGGFDSLVMGPIGYGFVTYSVEGITPTGAVPEPASFALLGLGLIGLATMRRRKQ